jgi:tripartite-type tricarboxylate transporter receptor subunit TctC
MTRPILTGALALAAILPAFVPAHAEDPFYKGKTVTIITSTGAGGQYDTIARAVARHMRTRLDGKPTMIVQNMPGGGNVLATNFMYNIAPKDGTTIATLHNAMPLHQVLDGRGVRFDARKFNWLGSTGPENSAIFAWHTAGVKTYEDVTKKEITLGGTGAGSGIVIFPTVANNLLGTRFKIVIGYKSSSEINVAMERGEVASRAFGLSSVFAEYRDRWVTPKKIVFLLQVGLKRDKRLPDVPLMQEVAKTDENRAILKLIAAPTALGKPYTAPPGLPADRIKILRDAFAKTLADKVFNAEMTRLHIDMEPMTAEETIQVVLNTVNAPPAIVEKAKKILPKKGKKKKGKE